MDHDIVFSGQRVRLPLVPMQGICVYPGARLIYDVTSRDDVAAVEEAMKTDQQLFLICQRNPYSSEEVSTDTLYQVGTICRILQYLHLNGSDTAKLMVEGLERAYLVSVEEGEQGYTGLVHRLAESETVPPNPVQAEALKRQCASLLRQAESGTGMDLDDLIRYVMTCSDPGAAADRVVNTLYFPYNQKQQVLEEMHPARRLALVNRLIRCELDIADVEQTLNEQSTDRIRKMQREMYLREQLHTIQEELGEEEDNSPEEVAQFREAVDSADLPEEVAEKLYREIRNFAKQPYSSPEASLLRNYLETCLALPWTTETEDTLDTENARAMLDADHFGLEKIKERVIEYLSVRQLAPEQKGTILCLVGPPGTGKTSIALSIARAMNRKMCRISLGGIHDEAEIRGHRKTYIGAMPGRIMTGIQQAGSRNPVMVLDEIDKLGTDYRGDPSSALLEALDPEQNSQFRDHFLEIPFDLSHVFFITTANQTDTIPPALLDRMEVVEFPSYTDEEKLVIARDHLLPKQRQRHGLDAQQLYLSDGAIRDIISHYTRESGVRRLEQELAAVCRKTAAGIVAGRFQSRSLKKGGLGQILGPARYKDLSAPGKAEVGLVHGLAWTQAGGEILDAETGVMEGTGKLELTGNLGDVMKESARAAMTYIRGRARYLGIDPQFYKTRDVHIHFPEGAVPKDGPSAGVTICTCLVSALAGVPVRQDLAMTGEITLRGRVLPVGGLREKTMAALRAGIHTVIIPQDNEPDLAEIDPAVRQALHFIPASRIETVLDAALCPGSPENEL